MLKINLISDTDAYKLMHPSLVKQGLTTAFEYGEARVGAKYESTVVFGMAEIIEKYLSRPIIKEDLKEACEISKAIHGENTVPEHVWNHVIDNCNGFLPIEIKCAPEGSIVPVGNVLFTITTEDPIFASAIGVIEPLIMHIWYSCTLATRSLNIYKAIKPLFEQTGDFDIMTYMINDFGIRGATNRDAAITGGMAHLLLFKGSDNILGLRGAMHYYNAESSIMSSVIASEHTVPLSFGRSGEKEYLIHMLDSTPQHLPVSILIDTYDTFGFIKNIVADPEIVEKIKNRKGKVIFRPDSGDPMKIVPTLLHLLSAIFGCTMNDNNYVVLNHVGLIQGDGMDEVSIPELYKLIVGMGYACSNLAVGSGGGLIQKDATRDTQRFAIKMSEGTINGESYNFKKQPSTDLSKSSKAGKLKLHPSRGSFTTISSAETIPVSYEAYIDVLTLCYSSTKETKTDSFDTIQKRLLSQIN